MVRELVVGSNYSNMSSNTLSTYAGYPAVSPPTGNANEIDGPANATGLGIPYDLAFDAAGNLYLADNTYSKLLQVTPGGTVKTLIGMPNCVSPCPTGLVNGVGTNARLAGPHGLALDNIGNVYIADTSNNVIRKYNIATGAVTTAFGGVAIPPIMGTSGWLDGPATACQVTALRAGAWDGLGNLYFLDSTRLRLYNTTAGSVSTLAGGATSLYADGVGTNAFFGQGMNGLAIDGAGAYVYLSQNSPAPSVIRRYNVATQVVSTFAGGVYSSYLEGVGTNAGFVFALGLAVDAARNVLYVADQTNYRVRAVNLLTAQTSTLAGTGSPGNGDGASCSLYGPYGLTVQPGTGNVYVADYTGSRIRMITPAGVCSTVAGFSGATSGVSKTA